MMGAVRIAPQPEPVKLQHFAALRPLLLDVQPATTSAGKLPQMGAGPRRHARSVQLRSGVATAARKNVILATCCLSLLVISMDLTILNVALPAIHAEFHLHGDHSEQQMQWAINIYPLVLASLLILGGATGDRYGRRRVFQIGLTVFGAASVLCSLAPNVETLIAGRFIQAVGGAMMNPVALSIISQVFPERAERARALGIWGAMSGLSLALGPVVGGVLSQFISWRAVFWINPLICLAALVLTAVYVSESKSATVRDVDVIGQLLLVIGLFGLVFVLVEGPWLGWSNPGIITAGVIATLALLSFPRHQSRRNDPLIDPRFFRSEPFASATAIALLEAAVWGAFLLVMSLYLQSERGYSATRTGLMFLPIAIGLLVVSPLSGRTVGRFGARPPLLVTGLAIITGSVLLMLLTATTPVWLLLVIFAVAGIAFGTVSAPIISTALAGMPLDRAGAAAAVISTNRQIGVSIGIALCAEVAQTAALGDRNFIAAARPLWWLGIAVGLVVAGLAISSTSARAERSAGRLAGLIEGSRGVSAL